MGKGRAKGPGSRKAAKLAATLGPKRAAKKLKVSESTLRRWKREGVPEARRKDVTRALAKVAPARTKPRAAPRKPSAPAPRPRQPAAPKPPNVRWKDTAGRWRNRSGTFAAAPHRKKTEDPRPRKHAPAPAPPKSRPSGPTSKIRPSILRPKPGRDFPQEILKNAGQAIGVTRRGYVINLPPLAGIPKWLSDALGVSEGTVRGWIEKNRVPELQRYRILAAARGGRIYGPWDSGRRSRTTKDERARLLEGLRAFEEARKNGWSMPDAHKAWRAVKDSIRQHLTKKAWLKLLKRIGRMLGLDETGPFSIASFTTS